MSKEIAAEVLRPGDLFDYKGVAYKAGKITRMDQPNGKDYIEVVTRARSLYLRTNETVKVKR